MYPEVMQNDIVEDIRETDCLKVYPLHRFLQDLALIPVVMAPYFYAHTHSNSGECASHLHSGKDGFLLSKRHSIYLPTMEQPATSCTREGVLGWHSTADTRMISYKEVPFDLRLASRIIWIACSASKLSLWRGTAMLPILETGWRSTTCPTLRPPCQ